MKQLRVVILCTFFALPLLSCCLPAFAQTLEPRLKGAIAESSRVTLPHSRPPLPMGAEDLGAVSPDLAIPGITLVFSRSAAQEAGLQQLLSAQQSTGSPLYHQWLTPDAFAARFGVADQDIAATETWLSSRGFHIDHVARSRDRITFSGTAAQVESAFGASLHHFRTQAELHFAPASDLTLPAELAPIAEAVLHLSDFRPRPSVPDIQAQAHPRPDYTALSSQAHYLGPKDLATMYDLNPLYQKNLYGSGQGLAVVGQSYLNTVFQPPVGTFLLNLVQSTGGFSMVLVPNSGVEAISPGDEGESEIDLEYSAGIAQQANIFLVYVGDDQNYNAFDALSYAITEDIAPVVSISYGICESGLSQSDITQQNALFEQAAAQGQTLVAASGDAGSIACEYEASSSGAISVQQQELAVSFPASSPYVTAVGGTQMAPGTFAPGANPYWSSASNVDTVSSLLSYVPEVVWNESSATLGLAASGGGASAVFPRAAWQTGVPGIASGSNRLVPDLALQSSVASPGFLFCTDDPDLLSLNGQTSSCYNGLLGNNNKYTTEGGTSFAAPVFAGFLAILNQLEQTNGLGNINPTLYSLAANPATYAAAFHDITTGTSACPSTLPNCPIAGQSYFAATTGYDEATGLGSVDFNALANAWPPSGKPDLTGTTTEITPSENTAAAGQTIPIQIIVASAYVPTGLSVPTGSVSVSVDGAIADPSLALSSSNGSESLASATYDFVAPASAGSHLVAVTYPGDAAHASSTATYALLVGDVTPAGGVSLAASNVTVGSGASGTTEVIITPSGGYGGRLVWSLSVAGGTVAANYCYQIASVPVSNVTSTQLTIGVGAACNSTSPAARGAVRPLDRRAAASGQPPTPSSGFLPASGVYAGVLLCGLFAVRRRRTGLPLLVLLLVLSAAGAGLTGCGGGGASASPTGSSGSSPGTPANPASTSYTVTLRGTDSVNDLINASTTFTLTVG